MGRIQFGNTSYAQQATADPTIDALSALAVGIRFNMKSVLDSANTSYDTTWVLAQLSSKNIEFRLHRIGTSFRFSIYDYTLGTSFRGELGTISLLPTGDLVVYWQIFSTGLGGYGNRVTLANPEGSLISDAPAFIISPGTATTSYPLPTGTGTGALALRGFAYSTNSDGGWAAPSVLVSVDAACVTNAARTGTASGALPLATNSDIVGLWYFAETSGTSAVNSEDVSYPLTLTTTGGSGTATFTGSGIWDGPASAPPVVTGRLVRLFVDSVTGQSYVVGDGPPDPDFNVPIGTTYTRRDAIENDAIYIRTTTGWQSLATTITGTGGTPPAGTALGDLSGTYPAPTVDGLQGRPITAAAPSTGNALIWNGTAWDPGTPTATPSGAAGGVLGGTYPNPSFAADMATQVELDAVATAKANLASPVFTGNPQAPTASPGDNDTSIATTAFVAAAIAGGGSALARQTYTFTTPTIVAGTTWQGTFALAKSYLLLNIKAARSTVPTEPATAWIRIYDSAAARTSDAGRALGTPIGAGYGLSAEVSLGGDVLGVGFSPLLIGANQEASPSGAIPVTIVNSGSLDEAMTVTLVFIPLEV